MSDVNEQSRKTAVALLHKLGVDMKRLETLDRYALLTPAERRRLTRYQNVTVIYKRKKK